MKYSLAFSGAAISALLVGALSQSAIAAEAAVESEIDEIIVTGRVLYSDQVNSLKAPTPVIDVPQSLSLIHI